MQGFLLSASCLISSVGARTPPTLLSLMNVCVCVCVTVCVCVCVCVYVSVSADPLRDSILSQPLTS